jgi:CRP-like cAMP-binding protein
MAAKEWLPAAVRASGTERKLKPGQALFRLGNRTMGLYEIVSGKVRLARFDSTGREIILHVAEPGDTIAEASLFSSTYHCDAIAMTSAVVRLYPKRAVLAELERNSKTARSFMVELARQVMALRSRLQQRDIRSARERVRHYLAMNVGVDGRTVALSGTIKDLAGELGLSHEALYRTLSEMAAHGEIERSKQRIRLAPPAV